MKTKLLVILLISLFIVNIPTKSISNPRIDQSSTDLIVGLSIEVRKVRTGDTFDFISTIINSGTEQSAKLILAINIVNLGDGSPVDPEDWSPLRTQFTNSLSPGGQSVKSWTIFPILKGDYLIYLVVIPHPSSDDTTSVPISSKAIHLTVTQYTRLNPKGILPLLISMPVGLVLIFIVLRWKRFKSVTRR